MSVKYKLLHLKHIAQDDRNAARLLWNLGFKGQASWLIHQSIEKFLKILWAKDKNFKSDEQLFKGMKQLDSKHDLTKLYEVLLSTYPVLKRNNGFFWIKIGALRYGEDAVGFSNKNFRKMELFVEKIRSILGDCPVRNRLLKECCDTVRRSLGWGNKPDKAETVVKTILSLPRGQTKKQRKQALRMLELL